jgi:hypothetical protein
MLERRGLAYAEVEKAIGADALPRAIARCTDCHARYYCGRRPARCINASIFTAALRKKALGAA